MGRFFAAIIVLLAIGGGVLLRGIDTRVLFGGSSFTKSVEVSAPGSDRGYYYRFKASFAYKGEPLDFDIVVGCNVRITTYKDNDRTVYVGIAPMAFGLKMKDRHGVVVRPPHACRGETTDNGEVPQNLLPLVVTYEDAEAPWSGIAYASEDAYESPISELKFFGATIVKATAEEWREWRRSEAPKNFITYELLGINAKNMWEAPHWKPSYRVMASGCLAASWVKLPEPVRDLVHRFWPSTNPLYWFPSRDMRDALWSVAVDPKDPLLFEGNRFLDYKQELADSDGSQGLPRHQSGAVIFFKHYVAGDLYPARIDRSVNLLRADGELPPEIKEKRLPPRIEAEARPELRGFAYCDDTVFKIEEVPGGFYGTPFYLSDINGTAINEDLQSWRVGSSLVLERDEFVILPRRYQIGTIFGGL
ncbi:hypothetical protein [Bradyrhizobium sp. HKCCYLS20291]|uniref:hypothetical protein n=1 Tax=Bradyrhizobium sp. HKCCYLS20291 TaxID=3420766 RepID=UPI003EC15118